MKVSLSTSKYLMDEFPNASKKVKNTVKKLVPRELPNCIGTVGEMYGVTDSGRIKFFAEDLAQMAKMSIKERLDFKERLIDSGRYYK